ncbi:Mini-ribonuclease 3 [Amphibacillus indicireducens]|uniref:Mini-ribonuclease 3 n=1 Tax=Amphibacillus indicireducens TaxID=1076330 RepID=A0ABP7VDB0_9BACI
MKVNEVKQMKSLALAYMGDAIYEVYVRDYLIRNHHAKVNDLHQNAIKYVAAKAQAKVLRYWLETKALDEEEEGVVRRGRNAKAGSVPKNTDIMTYRYSTAFEALLGFHYYTDNQTRLNELIEQAITFVERGR